MLFTHGLAPTESRPYNLIENLGDVFEKASFSGLTLPSSIPDHGERVMLHWTEINQVTLQKLI